MPARLIRTISSAWYRHPQPAGDGNLTGPFRHLKIALVTDQFTTDCLAQECQIRSLTPQNYESVIGQWHPDLIFIESAFHGFQGSWRYELAQQSSWLQWRKPQAIFQLLDFAKTRQIPTVFWNKDDGVYFDDFIALAQHCDFVLTSDQACIAQYQKHLPTGTPVRLMQMPYQPAFHYFDGFHFEKNEACFVGSYYSRILSERRIFLDAVFAASHATNLPIQIYDRNSHRISRRFAFRFPQSPNLTLHPAVSNHETAKIYKQHFFSINVNSVTQSPTMVSRRLLEILASGGILVSNPSQAVESEFKDFCHVVANKEEAIALFERGKEGPSADDLARARAGAEYVAQHHTWRHRLQALSDWMKL